MATGADSARQRGLRFGASAIDDRLRACALFGMMNGSDSVPFTVPWRMRRGLVRLMAALAWPSCAGCLSAPASSGSPSVQSVSTPSRDADDGVLDEVMPVGALQLYIHCEGQGKPLVVFEA